MNKKRNQNKIKQKSHTIPLKHRGFACNFQNLALSAYQHFTFRLRIANVFPTQVNQIMGLLSLTKDFKLLHRDGPKTKQDGQCLNQNLHPNRQYQQI